MIGIDPRPGARMMSKMGVYGSLLLLLGVGALASVPPAATAVAGQR